MEFFEKIWLYFQFPFVWYALITGILISLCSSLFGVTLVLKRFSFIGDGLSHAAFGAMAIAGILRINNDFYVVLPITIIVAVLLLKAGQNAKFKGDSAVAIISVSSLALGYLLLNIFSSSSNLSGDVCATLFGSTSILTLNEGQVWVCAALSIGVTVFYVLFYNKFFAVTFDETFAKATGVKTELYNLIMAVVIAVIVVLAMNLVGSLLITALIIFPATAAMRVFKSFKQVVVCAAIESVCSAAFGIVLSVAGGTPVGSTIVAVNLAVFLVFCVVSKIILVKEKGTVHEKQIS